MEHGNVILHKPWRQPDLGAASHIQVRSPSEMVDDVECVSSCGGGLVVAPI